MVRTRELVTFRLLTLASPRMTVGEISAPIFTPVALTYFNLNGEWYLGIVYFDPTNWSHGTIVLVAVGMF